MSLQHGEEAVGASEFNFGEFLSNYITTLLSPIIAHQSLADHERMSEDITVTSNEGCTSIWACGSIRMNMVFAWNKRLGLNIFNKI